MRKTYYTSLLVFALLANLVACQTFIETEHPRLEINPDGNIFGTSDDLMNGIPVFNSESGASAGQLVFDGHSSPPPGSTDYLQTAIVFPDEFNISKTEGFGVFICRVQKLSYYLWQIACESQSPELSQESSSDTHLAGFRI